MSLRSDISTAVFAMRFGLGGAVVVAGIAAQEIALAGIGILWMLFCPPILRHIILPSLFPTTTCPGCQRLLPLIGRFKCGDHYVDHRERHILTFCCVHGHYLESFRCPRCHSTILVQTGDTQRYKPGSAVRLRATSQLPLAGGLLLGHDSRGQGIHLPDERLAWHVAITGGTGRGKSTLLANMIVQLIEQRSGFTVLDPGGDLVKTIIQHVPEVLRESVVYIDVNNRSNPFPLNILTASGDLERATLTEELIDVFHRLHGSAWGPLLAHQLRMALRAVMTTGGTLRDVNGMFSIDGSTRARVVGRLPDGDIKKFWLFEFPAIPRMRWTAVTNKLTPIVTHPLLGPMICSPQCHLKADKVIAGRRIVLVNLASGSSSADVTTLLGTFLVHAITAAAFRQLHRPPEDRVRHVLIVDEFQKFMHKAAGFDDILATARKAKLALVVANQYAEQLSTEVRAALFGNVGCLAAFRVGHRDAKILVPEFSGAVTEDLLELNRGECLLRVGTDWTKLRTPPPPQPQHDMTEHSAAEDAEMVQPEADIPPISDPPVDDPLPTVAGDDVSDFVN